MVGKIENVQNREVQVAQDFENRTINALSVANIQSE